MKHPLLLLLLSATVQAQIPNNGFEAWSAPNGYDVPDGWLTLNDFTASYGVFTCAQGTPGHNSATCLQLITQPIPGLTTVAGQATSGNEVALVEGFPFAERPAELNGWWMYQTPLPGPDFGLISVTFTKWNPDIQQREDIGAGYLATSGTMDSWQPFAVPMTYISPEFPDTATISMISSGGLLQPGNTLSVDDLGFDSDTGVETVTATPLGYFSEGRLFLPSARPNDRLRVLDALGRELRTATVTAVPFAMDLLPIPTSLIVVECWRGELRTGVRVVP